MLIILASLLADRITRAGECAESNYTIKAIDFASRYCTNRGKSANACPNLMQHMAEIPSNYHLDRARPSSLWAISLAD